MSTHTFRLRRPWQRLSLPTVTGWRRAFHRPTGLEPGDRLRIRIADVASHGVVWLNGQRLSQWTPSSSELVCDVTSQVGEQNALVLLVLHGGDSGRDVPAPNRAECTPPEVSAASAGDFLASAGMTPPDSATAIPGSVTDRMHELAAALSAVDAADEWARTGGTSRYQWQRVQEEPGRVTLQVVPE